MNAMPSQNPANPGAVQVGPGEGPGEGWQPYTLQIQNTAYQIDQKLTSQWTGQFQYALDESTGKIKIAFQGSGTVYPGPLALNEQDARAMAVVAYQVDIEPLPSLPLEEAETDVLSGDQSPQFSSDQLSSITLGSVSPQTINSTHGQTINYSVEQQQTATANQQHQDTATADHQYGNSEGGSATAGWQGGLLGGPTVSGTATYDHTDSQESGTSDTDGTESGTSDMGGTDSGTSATVSLTDWGVTGNSDPATRVASWLFQQQWPYDAKTLGLDLGTWTWSKQAFDPHDSTVVLEFSDLSTSTMTLQVAATWEFERSLIEALPGKTVCFRLKDNIDALGVFSSTYKAAGGQPVKWHQSGGKKWSQAIDLSELLYPQGSQEQADPMDQYEQAGYGQQEPAAQYEQAGDGPEEPAAAQYEQAGDGPEEPAAAQYEQAGDGPEEPAAAQYEQAGYGPEEPAAAQYEQAG